MGKRKGVPQRVTEEKRQCMTWNMMDMAGTSGPPGSISVIPDDDPSLLHEIQGAKIKSQKDLCTQEKGEDHTGIFSHDFLQQIFDVYLDDCVLYISVFDKICSHGIRGSFEIGSFDVKVLNKSFTPAVPLHLPESSEYWLYVHKCQGQEDYSGQGHNMLYFETNEVDENEPKEMKQRVFWCVDINLPLKVLMALQDPKLFRCVGQYDSSSSVLNVMVYGTEKSITKPTFVSEHIKCKHSTTAIQNVISYFYNIQITDYRNLPFLKNHDIEKLYSVVKQCHDQLNIDHGINIQHECLRPLLRPYQVRGVNWMLQKERYRQLTSHDEPDLHMLYTKIMTQDKKTLYFNVQGGSLVIDRPSAVISPPGGILADEMGLGKTVEVLACIILHRRPDIDLLQNVPKQEEQLEQFERFPSEESTSSGLEEPTSQSETQADKADAQIISSEDSTSKGLEDTASQSEMIDSQIISDGTSTMTVSDKISTTESTQFSMEDNENIDQVNSSDKLHTNVVHPTPMANNEDCSLDKNVFTSSEYLMEKEDTKVVNDGPTETQTLNESTSSEDIISIEQSKCADKDTSDSLELSKKNTNRFKRSKPNKSNSSKINKSSEIKCTKKKSSKFVELVPEHTYQPKNIFDSNNVSQRDFFECICGMADKSTRRDKKHKVQCVMCGLRQHAECVSYDLSDPYRGEFKCPHCHVTSAPIKSGATLIISPSSISHQWVEEILKHIKKEALNVFVYNGVNKQKFVQPMTLARQDIVITSYETLRSEINYVDLPHSNSENGRKFRHPKRFMATPSPITAVEWWRICLDEAQMVECTTTKTAEMALRLSAVNRWCVTGTPIQKSIEDLYGLLLFLGVDPYWVKQWWTKLLYEPFCYGDQKAMIDLVSTVMWRTAKKDVLDQINIPQQSEHVHWLTFSPVEDHFYRRQYRNSIQDSMKRLDKWQDPGVKLSSLDRATANQLLGPLLRLRQACCHPQAVKGEFVPLHLRRSAMTMEELLESLTKKAKTECEESHRQLVAAYNGLAGWYIIKDQFCDAVDMYREVLRSVEEHKDQLRTDDLQQLHAMYNLDEILQSKPAGVQPTLRDGLLKEQMEELKTKYMTKSQNVVMTVKDQLAPIKRSLHQLLTEFSDGHEWWLEAIQFAMDRQIDEQMVDHVKNDLSKDYQDNSILSVSMARSFHNLYGLELVIQQRLVALESAYEKLQQALNQVTGEPTPSLINETVECCLRPVEGVKNSCRFCKIHLLFEDYESKLFSFKERAFAVAEDTTEVTSARRQGTWADSEVEKALKSLLAFARHHAMDRDLIKSGQLHLEIMDKWKKEFKLLRVLWIECKAYVSSFDELSMATTRLRLRMPDEPKPDQAQLNILEPAELDQHKLKLMTERTVSSNELRKKLGQLLYLQNLAKAQQHNEGGENPDLCPICQRELGKEWSVLHCGHCYCLDCIRVLCEQFSFGGRNRLVKCAVCREKSYHSDISYVSTVKSDQKLDTEMKVQGSHSTKVTGVVQCLKQIRREDPTAKVLVFSSWTDILNIIAQALLENDITFKTLFSGSKFQHNLSAFKTEEDITALLMPIHSGANGLNLIEATYVLLVEPVLNPAQELQAIGRVHRIGQTRPTQVHRFLIRGTIEQKMYRMLKSVESSASSHDTEENSLTVGDLTSLLKEEREEEQQDDEDMPGTSSATETHGPEGTSTTIEGQELPCTSTIIDGQESPGTSTVKEIQETPGTSTTMDGQESLATSTITYGQENPGTSTAIEVQETPGTSTTTEGQELSAASSITYGQENPGTSTVIEIQKIPGTSTAMEGQEPPATSTITYGQENPGTSTAIEIQETPGTSNAEERQCGLGLVTATERNDNAIEPQLIAMEVTIVDDDNRDQMDPYQIEDMIISGSITVRKEMQDYNNVTEDEGHSEYEDEELVAVELASYLKEETEQLETQENNMPGPSTVIERQYTSDPTMTVTEQTDTI